MSRFHTQPKNKAAGARLVALVALALAGAMTSGCVSFEIPLFQKSGSTLTNIVEAPDVAHYQFYMGREAFRRADYDESLKHFRAALRLQPDFVEARIGAGHALMELGRPGAARREYERARQVTDTPEVRLFLARANLFEGRLDEAAALAESARLTHPQPARVLELLGAAAYRAGQLADAEQYWTEALDEDQSNEELQALLMDLREYLTAYPPAADTP